MTGIYFVRSEFIMGLRLIWLIPAIKVRNLRLTFIRMVWALSAYIINITFKSYCRANRDFNYNLGAHRSVIVLLRCWIAIKGLRGGLTYVRFVNPENNGTRS